MAWEQLSINRPHWAYIILGGFTSLFMLVSLFVKQRLYIGEATVATICGIIFGPHAANLFNPISWGNVDQITLECSRIVLVVQCFAVGVELPKSYMERHWRSVVFLLVPVMAYGWLITSLFIWWFVKPLSWLDSLCVAACVTATDPVLASSVVGKGKFAKRVPKHLRDLLSAESGCNDGMAFPFIYLALYLIKYRPNAGEVIEHWVVLTILYECIFGAVYGFVVGYAARHAIKWAERHDMVDRESFLVFYFVLALFCAGTGSMLGLDDLLVGFAAGVGFSNDGWFQAKTEESHVSNVIDLLLNLAYFVYFGAIIPWADFNKPEFGLTPWRLVVIAILVILFRRIPIMIALKPIIPDIKTWREALFAGHFGPIGVGAIFISILARAELQTGNTTPLPELPPPTVKNYTLLYTIWPITTFLVISSILVHGSSIAVFTLGKRINTLSITMSYTQANEDGPSWMNRLPRIQTQGKTSNSGRKTDQDSESSDDKTPPYPPGTLPPLGFPGNFLRRQREEDDGSRQGSRPSSLRPLMRRKGRDLEMGPGGPISQSAITPQRKTRESLEKSANVDVDADADGEEVNVETTEAEDVQAYMEGKHMIVEDKQGNVLADERLAKRSPTDLAHSGEEAVKEVKDTIAHPRRDLIRRLSSWDWAKRSGSEDAKKPLELKRGPAHAYQFGNTIIVEDEDGEVVKKFDIPSSKKANADKQQAGSSSAGDPRQRIQRMGTWMGLGRRDTQPQQQQEAGPAPPDDDDRLRFVSGGRRMSKADFIQQIQQLDPKVRLDAVNKSDAPREVKEEARRQAIGAIGIESDEESARPSLDRIRSRQSQNTQPAQQRPSLTGSTETAEPGVPSHPVGYDIARYSRGTAAQRRREQAMQEAEDSDDDGTERVPPMRPRQLQGSASSSSAAGRGRSGQSETAAERRRREAALGMASPANDSDEDDEPRSSRAAVQEPVRTSIRFADEPTATRSRHDRGGRK